MQKAVTLSVGEGVSRNDTLHLRLAVEADGPQLLSLTRRCPMQGDTALLIDRAPDFFALCKSRGEGFTLVAEHHGMIIGCASVARRIAYVRGAPTRVGYIGDVKIHPDHRRNGIARRLLQEVERIETAAEPALYAGTTAAGNLAVDGLMLRFGEGRPVVPLGTFVSYQLLPILRATVHAGLEVGPASKEDELAGFLDDAHRRYTFGPVFRAGGLHEILARSPGMSLGDYLVARRAGRIVAALGVWDQHAIKQTRVLRMPPPLRWLASVMRAGSALGLPRLPREGEELRFCFARHPAGEPRALGSLLRHALDAARERADHFLLFTCAAGDPLASALAGIPRTTYRYRMVVGKNRPCDAQELEALTAALPFDDPALS